MEPPQPWKMPTTGKSPSGPLAGAGGKPTLMSIGAPSKVVKMPEQWRWPALAPLWTVHVMSPPAPFGMFGIAASAADGSASAPSTPASVASRRTDPVDAIPLPFVAASLPVLRGLGRTLVESAGERNRGDRNRTCLDQVPLEEGHLVGHDLLEPRAAVDVEMAEVVAADLRASRLRPARGRSAAGSGRRDRRCTPATGRAAASRAGRAGTGGRGASRAACTRCASASPPR